MNKIFFTMLLFLSSIVSNAQNPEELHFKDTTEKVYLYNELDSKPNPKDLKIWVKKFSENYNSYELESLHIKSIKQKFALQISEEGKIKDVKFIKEDVEYFDPSYETNFAEENKIELKKCEEHNTTSLKNLNYKWLLGYKNAVPVSYQTYIHLTVQIK
jgi:hypothetical protein